MTNSPFQNDVAKTTVAPQAEIPETTVISQPSQPEAAATDLPLYVQNELDDLRDQLAQSREDIAQLNETVTALTESAKSDTFNTQETDTITAVDNTFSRSTAFGDPQDVGQERDALLRSGIDEVTIASIQSRQDQQALTRLELLDQAARENWDNTDRLGEELEKLADAEVNLRDEIGDEAYDRFLFNSGRSNRVVIASIIQGSAADQSGLQSGDTIMRYAGSTVFTMRELRQATREGIRNEPILIEYDRAGERITADIVRGPLGVTMSSARVAPPNL